MKIVVLAGGLSPERDVSLSSGVMAANALIERGHQALLVDLFYGVEDLPADPSEAFARAHIIERRSIETTAPDLDAVRKNRVSGLSGSVGSGVIELCRAADIVYLALHGADGENGRLQAFFDLLDVRYTGSPSFGCGLAMHKFVTKSLFQGAGIPTPDGILLHRGDAVPAPSLPCVVKPCCGGSSIGIAIARTEAEYRAAVEDAFCYEDEILIEDYVAGRELTCGMLGGVALPPTEIIPKEGFYDYAHKYQPGWAEEITPAHIDGAVTARMQELTLAACKALHLQVYARADFLLSADGSLYCLEVNTLPGMTPTSLLPQAAAAVGMDYPSLCERIVNLSLRKYRL